MDARSAILARAREALARSQRGPARPIPRDYIRVGEHAPGSGPVVADMVDKLEDYDAVVRTEGAAISHTSGQRLYGKVEGDLMYALDRSTADHELRPHMWARLVKQ